MSIMCGIWVSELEFQVLSIVTICVESFSLSVKAVQKCTGEKTGSFPSLYLALKGGKEHLLPSVSWTGLKRPLGGQAGIAHAGKERNPSRERSKWSLTISA